LSALSTKRTERTGERERTLYFHIIHISGNKFPKMAKLTKNALKSPKIYTKKKTLKLKKIPKP
jgi:hypothetical protein